MTHLEKWEQSLLEIEKENPNNPALLWIRGYVFGLKHNASMASGSGITAVGVTSMPALHPQSVSRVEDND